MDNTVPNQDGKQDSFSTSSVPKSYVAEFEEYLHFAALQRLAEEIADKPADKAKEQPQGKGNWFTWFSDYKGQNVNVDVRNVESPAPPTADELERENASRALRLASWGTIFYLITTDILGPFNAPYAIAQVGWVPGIKPDSFTFKYYSDLNEKFHRYPSLRFQYVDSIPNRTSSLMISVIVGILATYTGIILWRLFIRLDSLRYPLRSYADIVERIFGKTARHIVTILQSLQLLIGVRLWFGNVSSHRGYKLIIGRNSHFDQRSGVGSIDEGKGTHSFLLLIRYF